MKKPDFFILGAPKCGTTSLDAWLKSHPRIFTAEKEPHYFNTDHNYRFHRSVRGYEALFEGASEQHLAVGEASVRYLHSRDAAANILRYNEAARFIVMVRNPVQMAQAWHGQLVFNGEEDTPDFEAAWHLQEARRAGRPLPRRCIDVSALLYGEFCRAGEQLQRLYQQVPAGRVHVVVFDDLKADPAGVYRAVLKFLRVPDDYQPVFDIHNQAKVRRLHLLPRLLTGALRPLGALKAALGVRKRLRILERIDKYNTRPQPRPALTPHMQEILTRYFHDDVRLLERLLKRDLSHWSPRRR